VLSWRRARSRDPSRRGVPRTAVRRHPKASTHLCTRSLSCLSPPLDRPARRPELGPQRFWLLRDILGRAPWRSGFPGPLRFRSQALSASQRFASRSKFHGLVACRSRSACPPTSTPYPHPTRAAEATSTDAEPRSRAGDRSLAVGLGSPSEPSPRVRHLRMGRPTWRSRASSGRPFRECSLPPRPATSPRRGRVMECRGSRRASEEPRHASLPLRSCFDSGPRDRGTLSTLAYGFTGTLNTRLRTPNAPSSRRTPYRSVASSESPHV
jgi:hypothetical protein